MLIHLRGRTFETIEGTSRKDVERVLGTSDLYQGVDAYSSVLVFVPRQTEEKEATTVYRFIHDAYHPLAGDWPIDPVYATEAIITRNRSPRLPAQVHPFTPEEVKRIRGRWARFLPYDAKVVDWNNRPADDDRSEPDHSISEDEGILSGRYSSDDDDEDEEEEHSGGRKRARSDDEGGRASKRQRVEGWIFVDKTGDDCPFDACGIWEPDPDDSYETSQRVRKAWRAAAKQGGAYLHRVLERFGEDRNETEEIPAEFVDVLPLLKKHDVEVYGLDNVEGTAGPVCFMRYDRKKKHSLYDDE